MDSAEFAILRERANFGNAEAQYELGQMYLRGENVARSEKTAQTWFRTAAEQGHRESQYIIGVDAYDEGSYKESAGWLEKAAEQGHVGAMHRLGCLYRDGKGVEKSDKLAARWFLAAAEQGEARSEFEVGRMCLEGRGLPKSAKMAAEWFAEAARQGIPAASYFLGCMYRDGRGVKRSYPDAARLLREAADSGNSNAMYALACLYRDGKGVKQSYEEAAKLLQAASDKGNSNAMYALACMHRGKLTDGSLKSAIELLSMAAEKGHPESAYELGCMHRDGDGVKQSYEKAARLFSKAAEKGHLESIYELGCMRRDGCGVEQSNKIASELFSKAVKKGHSKSLEALLALAEEGDCWALYGAGLLCRDGVIPDVDGRKTSDLLIAAHEKGCPDALDILQETAEKGDTVAQLGLGRIYERGVGVDHSARKAREWYGRAISQMTKEAETSVEVSGDDPDALNRTGDELRDRQDEQSLREAFKLYSKAAILGSREAQLSLGLMYRDGEGCERLEALAAAWIEESALRGLDAAQLELDHMQDKGCYEPASLKTSAIWYGKAAERGNTEAQFRMGMLYLEGEDVEQSDEKAAELFAKAAEKGYADAQYELGRMYLSGRGVEDSLSKAIELFTEAAKQGNASAIERISWMPDDVDPDTQFMLGLMYLQGEKIQQSDEKAAEWLDRAAKRGHAEAQYELEKMHSREESVQQSGEKAADIENDNAHHSLETPFTNDEEKRKQQPANSPKKPPQEPRKTSQKPRKATCEEPTRPSTTKNQQTLVEARVKADSGNAKSQLALGRMLLDSDKEAEGYRWISAAARSGDEEALSEIMNAARYDASRDGNMHAQYELGMMLLTGEGVDLCPSKGTEWLRRSAKQGNKDAKRALGEDLQEPKKKETKRAPNEKSQRPTNATDQKPPIPPEEKTQQTRAAAEKGNAEAQLALGRILLDSNDEAEGYKWISAAARRGNPDALFELKDTAHHGNMHAQYELGMMFLTGDGVDKSPSEGTGWLRRSAGQGNKDAEHALSEIPPERASTRSEVNTRKTPHSNSDAVDQAARMEIDRLRRSAEQGDPDAQYKLGMAYVKGSRAEWTDGPAYKWISSAARSGHRKALKELTRASDSGRAYAQYELGMMLLKGEGVKQSMKEALELLDKAAEGGVPDARSELDRLKAEGMEKKTSENSNRTFLSRLKRLFRRLFQ